jgi:hypothetical protein
MVNPLGKDDGYNYDEYARHCLRLAARTADRDSRVALREMAAEWLQLWETSGLGGFNRSALPDVRG